MKIENFATAWNKFAKRLGHSHEINARSRVCFFRLLAGRCSSRNNNAQHNHRSETHAVSASIEDERAVEMAAFLDAHYGQMAAATVAVVVAYLNHFNHLVMMGAQRQRCDHCNSRRPLDRLVAVSAWLTRCRSFWVRFATSTEGSAVLRRANQMRF